MNDKSKILGLLIVLCGCLNNEPYDSESDESDSADNANDTVLINDEAETGVSCQLYGATKIQDPYEVEIPTLCKSNYFENPGYPVDKANVTPTEMGNPYVEVFSEQQEMHQTVEK